MSDLYVPLDPRPDAAEITPIDLLRAVRKTVTLRSFSVKEIESMAIDPKSYIIGEIDYTNPRIAANFVVGDTMLKVNDSIPTTFVHLSKLLAASGDITILIKRRAFVTPPGHVRVQAAMTALKLSVQKNMSYMVVTCKKVPYDVILSNSFGFTLKNVNVTKSTKKFIVVQTNGNTAAEKYFSVGDNLIDFCGLPIENDGKILKQFNMTFQTVGKIDVLIERPIIAKNREESSVLIKEYLVGDCSAAGKPIVEKKKAGSAAVAPVAVTGGATKDISSKSAGKSSSSERRSEKDKLTKEKSVDGSEKLNRKRNMMSDSDVELMSSSPQKKKDRRGDGATKDEDEIIVVDGVVVGDAKLPRTHHPRAEMVCLFAGCSAPPLKNCNSLLSHMFREHDGWTLAKKGLEAQCNAVGCTAVFGSGKHLLPHIDKCQSAFTIRPRRS